MFSGAATFSRMPIRVPASPKQRELFSAVAQADNMVLSMLDRPRDHVAAVNAHGRFVLIDKHWPGAEDGQNFAQETLIAVSMGNQLTFADTGEPSVHVHADWSAIRYAWIGSRPTTLIGTDKEIVFCTERDKATRVLWFHLWRWEQASALAAWPREEFIDLAPLARRST